VAGTLIPNTTKANSPSGRIFRVNHMIIFSRWGILVVIFAVLAACETVTLDKQYGLSTQLFDIIFLALWGGACIVAGSIVDALGSEGSLFWIPMQLWGFAGIAVAFWLGWPDSERLRQEAGPILAGIATQSANAKTASPPAGTQTPVATPTASPPPATAQTRSDSGRAAYDYLARNLTGTVNILYTGNFKAVGDDICHIAAVETFFLVGTLTMEVRLADVDLDSPEIKGEERTFRALNFTAAKDKTFRDSAYDFDKKQWGPWDDNPAAAFIVAGGNEDAILRAFDTLATDCGAKPNGF
jgi:hypothetical protein